MRNIPSGPDVLDMAPADPATLTAYDHEHAITYLRLLDANAEGADWREVARLLLHIDPDQEPARAATRRRINFIQNRAVIARACRLHPDDVMRLMASHDCFSTARQVWSPAGQSRLTSAANAEMHVI